MARHLSKQPERKRVFIVDDHPVFREGLVELVGRDPQLTVCGEADSASQAISAIETRLASAPEREQEYQRITRDHASTQDLYNSLLKRYEDAQQAMDRALKMGTPEPGFHYHAGMIASALGRKPGAKKHLERALALNPKFDISQAPIAEKALAKLRN